MAVQQQPFDNYYFLQNKEEIETSIPKEVEKASAKKTDKINLAQILPPDAAPVTMDS